jgi:hypothetical protein
VDGIHLRHDLSIADLRATQHEAHHLLLLERREASVDLTEPAKGVTVVTECAPHPVWRRIADVI